MQTDKPAAYRVRDADASEHYGRDVWAYWSANEFREHNDTPRLLALLEPLFQAPGKMVSSPTEPGWYWCIEDYQPYAMYVVRVSAQGGHGGHEMTYAEAAEIEAEWWGPIVPPERPNKEFTRREAAGVEREVRNES